MIQRVSKERFLELAKVFRSGMYRDCIFFAFEREEVCNFKENHNFSISIGLELSLKEEVVIEEGEVKVCPTGVKWCADWERGFYFSILPRSGLSKNTPLRIANAPGTVEPTYRNDIGVLLECVPLRKEGDFNWKGIECRKESGKWKVKIPIYSRVAQGVVLVNFMVMAQTNLTPYISNIFYCVDKEIYDNFHEIFPSERGLKGYGSTGV